MPRISKNLVSGARISVTRRYLRKDRITASKVPLSLNIDLPGTKLLGYLIRKVNNRLPEHWEVQLDDIADHVAILPAGGLRYEGTVIIGSTSTQAETQNHVEVECLEDELHFESAEEFEENIELLLEPNNDTTWDRGGPYIDVRLASPQSSWSGSSTVHINNKQYASPRVYFERFLPIEHIQKIVIPAINSNALKSGLL